MRFSKTFFAYEKVRRFRTNSEGMTVSDCGSERKLIGLGVFRSHRMN